MERNPNWIVERPALPCAAVFDGSERAEDQNVRDQFIVSSVSVEITAIMPTLSDVLTDLNCKMALVQQALADNGTLSGCAQRVRYVGCDEPDVVDLTASPCEASLEVNFEIERLQTHASPYE